MTTRPKWWVLTMQPHREQRERDGEVRRTIFLGIPLHNLENYSDEAIWIPATPELAAWCLDLGGAIRLCDNYPTQPHWQLT